MYGQIKKRAAGILRIHALIQDRDNGITVAFGERSERLVTVAPSITMPIRYLDIDARIGLLKGAYQLREWPTGKRRQDANPQTPSMANRFHLFFGGIARLQNLFFRTQAAVFPAGVATTCACRRSSNLTFSSASSFAMLAEIAGCEIGYSLRALCKSACFHNRNEVLNLIKFHM